jgi:hypothetical protein
MNAVPVQNRTAKIDERTLCGAQDQRKRTREGQRWKRAPGCLGNAVTVGKAMGDIIQAPLSRSRSPFGGF